MANGGPRSNGSSAGFTWVLVAAAVVGGVYLANHFSKRMPSVGDIAQEITGKDFEGKEFRLSDYRGQVVMLDFFGNW